MAINGPQRERKTFGDHRTCRFAILLPGARGTLLFGSPGGTLTIREPCRALAAGESSRRSRRRNRHHCMRCESSAGRRAHKGDRGLPEVPVHPFANGATKGPRSKLVKGRDARAPCRWLAAALARRSPEGRPPAQRTIRRRSPTFAPHSLAVARVQGRTDAGRWIPVSLSRLSAATARL